MGQRQSRKVRGALGEIDRRIGSRRPAIDASIDLGDIAIGSTLLVVECLIANGFVPALDVLKWQESNPNLVDYAGALDQRPSFIAHPPGDDGRRSEIGACLTRRALARRIAEQQETDR